MTKNYFVINESNVVENIIVLDTTDLASALSRLPANYYLIEQIRDNILMAINDIYEPIGGTWITPTPPVIAGPRIISKLTFRQRFTELELEEIDDFANSGTLSVANKKTVRTLIGNFNAASKIDLDNLLISEGLDYLETFSLIAVGRKAEIMA